MSSKPEMPDWATTSETHGKQTRFFREVGVVDLGDGAASIIVRVGQIAWLPAQPLGVPQPVPTRTKPFVDIRRVTDGKPSDDIGALSAQAAAELAGLLAEAVRLTRHFTGGTR